MNIVKKNRDFNQPLIWNGDLNDDCTAEWSGLILRAEWMDEDYWWWCVYDMLDNENQIASSNEYNERIIGGEKAREKAEEVARNYLKKELVFNHVKSKENNKIDKLIVDLKNIGISPMHSILVLEKDIGFDFDEAKNIVFDSLAWKGLREQSELLTQAFLDAEAQNADEVEIIDERVASITFDLIKDNNEKSEKSFWTRVKSIFK